MNILQNRIDSFQNNTVKWPYADKQQYHKTETFAKAGFYFMRRPRAVDSVRCFMCDIDLCHWRPGQSPYTRHAAESSTCPWVLLNFPDAATASNSNRALTVNEKDPTTQPQHKIMRAARLATFNHHHYWPPNKSLKSRRFQVASKLSDAGFYFTPTSDSTARIKCPYCKATIMEPDKTIDALQLNDTCPFFGPQRKSTAKGSTGTRKSRRDTTASTASSDTYKTAKSQSDPSPQTQEEEEEEEDENVVPRKRKAAQEEEQEQEEEKEDDDIWDINHFLNIPAHVKKPTLTYGNKSTQRRTRQRVLPSAGKRTHVDIFSNLDLSSSPSLVVERPLKASDGGGSSSKQAKKPSLIEKVDTIRTPRTKRTATSAAATATATATKATKKREPKRTKTAKEKAAAAAPSPTLPHAATTKEVPAVASASASASSSKAPATTTAQNPPPQDESLLLSPVFPPPDPILLDKPLAAIPIKFNEPTTTASPAAAAAAPSSPPLPAQSLEDLIFSDENDGPVPVSSQSRDKGKQRQVEHAIVPKKTSSSQLSLSKSGRASIPKRPPPPPPSPAAAAAAGAASPTRSRNSDVAASLAKQMKYLQSTPMHNVGNRAVNVMDIFGDCPLSPISSSTTTSAATATTPAITHMRTPAIMGTASSSVDGVMGRMRSVFTADGQRRPPPPSSNSNSTKKVPIMTLDVNAAPPVTAEQKQMSVEIFIQHVVDESIRKVRQQGEELIENVREKSDGIKQDLLSQKQ
ncbi:hypothetical protein MBANPS3_001137 [Mucor bainieri]